MIRLTGIENAQQYRIFDAQGKQLLNGIISDGQHIDIADFENGVYFIQVDDNEALRFVKQ